MLRWLLTSALALFAAPASAGRKAPVPAIDAELVARLRALPDATDLAQREQVRVRYRRDLAGLEDAYAAQLAAEKRVFLRFTFRRKTVRCSTREHQRSAARVKVHDHSGANGPRTFTIDERALHEVEAHGGALTAKQRELLATLPVPPAIPAGAPSDAALVAHLRTLPDVTRTAIRADEKVLVRTNVYRTMPSPCSTGAHRVPHVDVEVEDRSDPQRPRALLLREDELHEVELHGRPLPVEVRAFLHRTLHAKR